MAVSLSQKFVGAVKDEWSLFSDRSQDYTIGSPIGFGSSSVVYAAVYDPPPPEPQRPIPCALKVLDLDTLPLHSLSLLQRETQLMSLSKHPNVLRVRGSWMDGHKLYIALRLMNKGSASDVMRYSWPGGMEEEVVKCILKQALEGLNYLHINGFIHRDVKAANLLIDDDGTVLVGDLGVAASLADETSGGAHTASPLSRPHMGKRKSFVGTPCWMAPELIQGKHYDAKADIWSFAITAIELTQGRPPRSRESAHAVLLQTVQGKPPTLDRDGGVHRYSRAFKDIVDACLVKDPLQRPTAAQLLQTAFFKSAKKKFYLVSTILDGLPPLTMRQERRRRPPSLMSHGTMESWDFGSSMTGSTSPKIPQGSKSRTSAGQRGSEQAHRETADIHSRVHLDISKGVTKDGHVSSLRRIITDVHSVTTLPPALDMFDTEKETQGNSSPSTLSLSASPSASLDSAQSSDESAILSASCVPMSGPGQPGTARIQPAPSTSPPIPIPKRKSLSMCKPSLASPPTRSLVPGSAPPSTSPSFWNRLTHTPSHSALGNDESSKEEKHSAIARFLRGRRGSSSHAQGTLASDFVPYCSA